ncbi:MAG: TIGR03560 family F420-dependent LLM class oxidoreductase [Ardenticatenaceae bacterium]|nr:TIGR03560 family F420-dependent LLM class oxidoreductase [Ardenticatenaceae bacterium]HBY92682.1 LLM class F420-dependent oxidoreductase [Chloroflexota bacterium]
MIEVAIMLEGQNGLNWPRWERLARAVEDLGFVGLYRSDHFTNPEPPDRDALDLWLSLTWLASHTRRIEFGSLVTPVSFRHPVHTARMGLQVDNLSGGRLTLGMGAGWQAREHTLFGFDLLDLPQRFERFHEGLEVITRLLRSNQLVSFQGKFYRLHDAVLLPRPQRPGRPPILVGGNGRTRTLPLAAAYADEWNGTFLTPARFSELSARLDRLLEERGRRPGDVRRSMMTNVVFGRDEAELLRNLQGRPAAELRAQGRIVGTPSRVVEQLGTLAEAGVQRVMLQWLDLDDLDRLEAMATSVLPQAQGSVKE